MLLGASPVVMANADKSNSGSVYEINQQTGLTLKGVVKDVKNEPLIGVNVLIKGTTTGAITDLYGAFTLNVKKGDVLVISYTGYERQLSVEYRAEGELDGIERSGCDGFGYQKRDKGLDL